MSFKLAVRSLAACAALLPLAAGAVTLDFGNNPAAAPVICSSTADGLGTAQACSPYDYVLQSFGDIAGVVDITYSQPRETDGRSLRWWATDYNNLYGVVWADGGGISRGRIEIKAANPLALVSLASLDLGAYANTTRTTNLQITTIGGGSTLVSFAGSVGVLPGNTASRFTPNVGAVGGLWIDWYDEAYDVGIDNINYTVGAAVPEPGTAAVLLAGLAAVSMLARRRSR